MRAFHPRATPKIAISRAMRPPQRRPDDDLHAHALETVAHVDAILFGSGTYRLLAPHWSQAARDASGTEVTNEFARVFAATPKILFPPPPSPGRGSGAAVHG